MRGGIAVASAMIDLLRSHRSGLGSISVPTAPKGDPRFLAYLWVSAELQEVTAKWHVRRGAGGRKQGAPV